MAEGLRLLLEIMDFYHVNKPMKSTARRKAGEFIR